MLRYKYILQPFGENVRSDLLYHYIILFTVTLAWKNMSYNEYNTPNTNEEGKKQ